MTTSKQLTLEFGEEKSMSSPVDFLASRSVPLEKGWEKKMIAIFGPKCSGQSEKSKRENVLDCIECGSCSFVCPSNRPILDYIRLSKTKVKKLK